MSFPSPPSKLDTTKYPFNQHANPSTARGDDILSSPGVEHFPDDWYAVETTKHMNIIIMGPTGAGKSTFINAICNSSLAVGDGLKSCTHRIEKSAYRRDKNTVIHLIDTPGFDDSTRSDVEILQEIAFGLQTMHETGVYIHGIIYMHRISDQRMPGSARRNLSTFLRMCGSQAMDRAAIVTNMWGLVAPEVGEAREAELSSSPLFFETAIKAGAKLHRNDNPPKSALEIISKMILDEPVTLQIQDEMVVEKRHLLETTAGKELDWELAQQRAKHEADLVRLRKDHALTLEQRDVEAKEELEAEIAHTQAQIRKIQGEATKLRERKPFWLRFQAHFGWLKSLVELIVGCWSRIYYDFDHEQQNYPSDSPSQDRAEREL